MIRTLAKSMVRQVVRSQRGWQLVEGTLLRAAEYARWERTQVHDPEAEELARFNREHSAIISPTLTVKNGPFAGMQYLEGSVTCGPFMPRLLGSYEQELHELLERICSTQYSEIIDVGCAEGFYAVGLARRIKGARVFAYDTNARAQQLCRAMAEANGVSDRVTIHGYCSPETLLDFAFTGRGLIVCDCEGYETTLFSPAVAEKLSGCDVLVELHDIFDPTISSRVLAAFAGSHDVTLIDSIDETKKAKSYQYPELSQFDLVTRKKIVSEDRAGIMQWAYFSPRSRQSSE
jgi:hypothetical protein